MAEVARVQARPLELFAPPGRRRPLRVPPAARAALARLGIESVQDLLQHYPRHHVDRTTLRTIRELMRAERELRGREVQVLATVESVGHAYTKPRPGSRKPLRVYRGRLRDETGVMEATWFNADWIPQRLKPGTEAFFWGRLERRGRYLRMTMPRFELVRTGREPFNVGRVIPVYPATSELSSDRIRRLIWDVMRDGLEVVDPLPPALARRLHLMSRGDALRTYHFPSDPSDVAKAEHRLVFDEVFTLQLGLVYRKRKLERTVKGIIHARPGPGSLAEAFLEGLPFEPTGAQRRACAEVAADMSRPFPMHRLVEGEVGSGKTVVALYACLVAVGGGYQAAIMAPTEVLAEQHHLTVSELLDRAFGPEEARNLFAAVSRRPVVRLLTGSTPAATRARVLAEVAAGEVDVLIGTHALIQDAVDFPRLGVVVVDEQHRFGVHQRRALRAKGAAGEPDVLVLTATPIPRTLAVSIYGDLDISVLDELPKGRRPVATRIAAGEAGRRQAYELIRREVAAGRQAFVVYALRDESDRSELRSAKAEARRLQEEVFPGLRVGLVHGDMRSEDKEGAMAAFRDNETQVLVATTVVEVGVDVPNATVMLIENAERFGLAQLHQLRGRVGRGTHPSYCVLATDLDLSRADSDPAVAAAAERLQAVASTTDGFRLAQLDLRMRGEGELFGARQSGMPQLRLARVLQHKDTVVAARRLAEEIVDADPELEVPEHAALRREMFDRFPEHALDVARSG